MSKEKDLYQLKKEMLELKKLEQEIEMNDLKIKQLNMQNKTFLAGWILGILFGISKIIDMIF